MARQRQSAAWPSNTMQITLGLQHELQFCVTMAAADVSFYLYSALNILNVLPLQADDNDSSSGVEELRGWPAKTGHG